MILELNVRDPEAYGKYVESVPATVERYGGRYIIRGGAITSLSGDWHPERIVVLEFPSMEDLRRWNSSPEYLEIAALREQSASAKAIIAEGYEGTP